MYGLYEVDSEVSASSTSFSSMHCSPVGPFPRKHSRVKGALILRARKAYNCVRFGTDSSTRACSWHLYILACTSSETENIVQREITNSAYMDMDIQQFHMMVQLSLDQTQIVY